MLGYSVSKFLPEYWSNQPLYAEKLIPLLDNLLTNNCVESDKISENFYELINKYKNTTELSKDSLVEFVKENGYGYILDLLSPNILDFKLLIYLLVLIHELKGSDKGVKVVLSLLQEDSRPLETTITNWFDLLPVGEENTFDIDSKLDVSKLDINFFTNFSNFIKNYVYPELREFTVRYGLSAELQYIAYSVLKVTYTSYSDMD